MNTKKRFFLNVASTYLFKIVNIVCAFIVPRLIIGKYGSETNGLVVSITQFLSVIALADMGVGTVVLTSLYKPIEANNKDEISRILVSARKYYRNLGYAFAAYVMLICIIYPYISKTSFDIPFIVLMVVIMSANTFSQYFFGIVSKQFLTADQKRYIVSLADSIVMIINTILCVFIIQAGWSIHAVKLCTAICYSLSPFAYYLYTRQNYDINWHITYNTEPIKQKWEGLSQHISYYVTTNTDIIVLTIFSGALDVSVYSVYVLALKGVNTVLNAFDSAIQPVLGAHFARNNMEEFRKKYCSYQFVMMNLGTVFYGCAYVLIRSFVLVYTKGINDVQYDVPLFAAIITIAYTIDFWASILRMLVNVTGSFKDTHKSYILTALINVVLSIVLVYLYGIIGVAVGTLVAVLFQFVSLGIFAYVNVLKQRIAYLWEILAFNSIVFAVGVLLCNSFHIVANSYLEWTEYAVLVFVVWLILMAFILGVIGRRKFGKEIQFVWKNIKR